MVRVCTILPILLIIGHGLHVPITFQAHTSGLSSTCDRLWDSSLVNAVSNLNSLV